MADVTDNRLIAAHLAGALINQVPLAPENAAKLYFDCLEAVGAEQDRRKKPTGPISGSYGTR